MRGREKEIKKGGGRGKRERKRERLRYQAEDSHHLQIQRNFFGSSPPWASQWWGS